jgi:hypothetical protein
MSKTRAQQNRHIRQEALREQLQAQGHVQHVVEIVDKVRDPDHFIDNDMIARYKIAIDTKLKLINKYCPDLKQEQIEANINHTMHEDWLARLEDDNE